jgi:LPS sulfotransferase NodH
MTTHLTDQSRPPIRLSYLICTTPRSGSNFLCEVLRSTGVAGRPDEYFWNPALWQEPWDTPKLMAYVREVREIGTTPNGVFGAKLMWHYLGDLLPRLAAIADLRDTDPLAILSATFPNLRYIQLTRRDKVRQGISWYRAWKTHAWRSTDRHPGADAEPAFNYSEISSLVEQAIVGDQSWQELFQQHGIEPLVITYEDLAAAPTQTALRILDHLDLPRPAAPWPPSWQHQRQSDAVTDAWVRQYHAQKR